MTAKKQKVTHTLVHPDEAEECSNERPTLSDGHDRKRIKRTAIDENATDVVATKQRLTTHSDDDGDGERPASLTRYANLWGQTSTTKVNANVGTSVPQRTRRQTPAAASTPQGTRSLERSKLGQPPLKQQPYDVAVSELPDLHIIVHTDNGKGICSHAFVVFLYPMTEPDVPARRKEIKAFGALFGLSVGFVLVRNIYDIRAAMAHITASLDYNSSEIAAVCMGCEVARIQQKYVESVVARDKDFNLNTTLKLNLQYWSPKRPPRPSELPIGEWSFCFVVYVDLDDSGEFSNYGKNSRNWCVSISTMGGMKPPIGKWTNNRGHFAATAGDVHSILKLVLDYSAKLDGIDCERAFAPKCYDNSSAHALLRNNLEKAGASEEDFNAARIQLFAWGLFKDDAFGACKGSEWVGLVNDVKDPKVKAYLDLVFTENDVARRVREEQETTEDEADEKKRLRAQKKMHDDPPKQQAYSKKKKKGRGERMKNSLDSAALGIKRASKRVWRSSGEKFILFFKPTGVLPEFPGTVKFRKIIATARATGLDYNGVKVCKFVAEAALEGNRACRNAFGRQSVVRRHLLEQNDELLFQITSAMTATTTATAALTTTTATTTTATTKTTPTPTAAAASVYKRRLPPCRHSQAV
eukprot:TRINITY_DN3340_c2_g2_i4.p1 TRINITY_DN3340_c2_g2~~TRINITY_DN3340_c2_g2_i4.p1  ORF type:complete len:639 (-),score=103.05 TRINITY_DN3340_c2_g2_i4:49-1965(-)